MTTLRLLLFVLFALALLPGAHARAAMPVQATAAMAVHAAGTEPGGCHDAPDPGHAAHGDARGADASEVTGSMPPMECCPGDDGGGAACDDACACPLLVPGALMHGPVAGEVAPGETRWQRHGLATRTGPPDGPPKRPPIG